MNGAAGPEDLEDVRRAVEATGRRFVKASYITDETGLTAQEAGRCLAVLAEEGEVTPWSRNRNGGGAVYEVARP